MTIQTNISIESILENTYMTTRDIADLTGKRHNNVLADVRKLYELMGTPRNKQGWLRPGSVPGVHASMPVAKLNLDQAFTLIAGYNMMLRVDVVNKLLELITAAFRDLSIWDVSKFISEMYNAPMKVVNVETGKCPLYARFNLSDIFMSYTRFAQPMTSREISELTGKRHDNVIYDIRQLINMLSIPEPNLWGKYIDSNGRPRITFMLPINLAMIVACGYDKLEMYNVIKGFLEIKDGDIRGIVEAVEAELEKKGMIIKHEGEPGDLTMDEQLEQLVGKRKIAPIPGWMTPNLDGVESDETLADTVAKAKASDELLAEVMADLER